MAIELINDKFITFEGIDGSGKSTQIELLNNWLDSKGVRKINIREPGGSNISENIRTILLNKNNNINPFSETLLFLASRSQLVDEIIIPELKKDKFLLCDRFIDSTVVYQGYGRNLDIELINNVNSVITQGVYPKLTIYIKIEIDLSLKRRVLNDDDRMESEGLEFLSNVKKGYDELALLYPERIKVINGDDTIDNIHKKIKKIMKDNYKELLC